MKISFVITHDQLLVIATWLFCCSMLGLNIACWWIYLISRHRKKIITGCEERGDALVPYLTRWTLFDSKWLQICLHKFHRSDADDLHDHPWDFKSLIIWRGYLEEIRCPECNGTGSDNQGLKFHTYSYGWLPELCTKCMGKGRIQKRVYPGMLLFRKAEHSHRVVLVNGKPAWSLVFMGKRRRTWGFWIPEGWIKWTSYFKAKGC